MTPPVPIVVPPSLLKMLGVFVVSNLGFAVGCLACLGPGLLGTIVLGTAAALTLALVFLAVFRRRPSVSITDEGFTLLKLVGGDQYRWSDVEGSFAVIKLGLTKAVGFKLTDECLARLNLKPSPALSGYHAAVTGAFAMSPAHLAALLNEHKERSRAT
jgi:hypothetical protein